MHSFNVKMAIIKKDEKYKRLGIKICTKSQVIIWIIKPVEVLFKFQQKERPVKEKRLHIYLLIIVRILWLLLIVARSNIGGVAVLIQVGRHGEKVGSIEHSCHSKINGAIGVRTQRLSCMWMLKFWMHKAVFGLATLLLDFVVGFTVASLNSFFFHCHWTFRLKNSDSLFVCNNSLIFMFNQKSERPFSNE